MMQIKRNKIAKEAISYVLIIIGSLVASFSLDVFLVPNHIMDGGITGVSIITNHLTRCNLSTLLLLYNMPFVIISWQQSKKKKLGSKFYIKMIVGVILYALFTYLLSSTIEVTYDTFLASIFGGILLGIGCGIVFRAGGCLDGTEVIAIMIDKTTTLSVGQVILVFNTILYLIAGLLFGWDQALYSMVTYFIVSRVEDMILDGFNQAKACFIITDESARIAENIYNKLERTVTVMEGSGLVSGSKVVLYCVITRMEIMDLKEIVETDDASAFVVISDVADIIGKHIKKKDRKVVKKLEI